ncbi:DUF6456 domain-containing protein [Sphingorhabdus sp.]|jgi:hypothetical protein|uniref:DUF6456 domain-containing protein n=1 Tax=Sphingorhabdus sp. TaxID=1902408 RepID=UPI003BAEAAD7
MPRTAQTKSTYDPRMLVERAVPDPEALKGAPPRRTVTVNLAESPLSWLHAHGHLTDRQLLAGEKLRGDYERAALGPRTTMAWVNMPVARGRHGAPSPLSPTEAMLRAKQRFDGAMEALGRDLSDIAWRVICACESVSVAEKGMGWPTRSGKLVLRIALDRLADFYRVPG